jgi:hypothetical protein
MYQQFKRVNRSWVPIARDVISVLLWVTERLLRVLLRRPVLDVLLLLLVLWFIAGFIGNLTAPQPVLLEPPAVFEGR